MSSGPGSTFWSGKEAGEKVSGPSALHLHPPKLQKAQVPAPPGPRKHKSQGPVSSVYTSHWGHREICKARVKLREKSLKNHSEPIFVKKRITKKHWEITNQQLQDICIIIHLHNNDLYIIVTIMTYRDLSSAWAAAWRPPPPLRPGPGFHVDESYRGKWGNLAVF